MKDLYKILGVSENADDTAIKKAYRKLAKQYHPDVTGNDKKKTERFKDINEAYAVLGDNGKRKEYDRLKHAPVRPDGMPEGFDPEAFARAFGGRAGGVHGRATPSGVEFPGGSGGNFDVGDIFSSLFGGNANAGRGTNPWVRTRTRQNRGADIVGQLPISFAEAALGTNRTIRTGDGNTVEIAVPPGVDSGGRLRVPGQGAAGPGKDAVAGDLYLDVEVRPDPTLRRDGVDIEMSLPITVAEAALGAKVEAPTVEGPVTVSIPPGTSSGAKLRLRGKGIKRPDGTRGDQFCRIEIVVPKIDPSDAETRRLFEEISRRTAQGASVRKF